MIAPTSGWVNGTGGQRWQACWQPGLQAGNSVARSVRGTVLFLPPIGDEMNHARPLVAAAARRLAGDGWRVLVTDPSGTGDSAGDFAEASLRQWAEDFAADAAQAAVHGPWVLWAARQGALLLPALAVALARHGVPLPVAQVFWNPVWQGSAVVTQWLRIAALAGAAGPHRLAEGSTASAGNLAGTGVAVLREHLATGATLNCAGYALTPALSRELEAVQAAPLANVPTCEWDAAAWGARRFWLPHEEAMDTTLVAPLVEWLGHSVAAGETLTAAPITPVESSASAVAPVLCLEVPQGAVARCGVLFIVGGPQYRVGAHRQFLRWARRFNTAGHATCRFDRAGTGDAGGARAALEDCGAELRTALEAAVAATGVERWVVLGLCDGATLALLHLARHTAVAGMVALNPWVPATPSMKSQALVREYYGRQLWSGAFWRRLLRGEVTVLPALREWWSHRQMAKAGGAANASTDEAAVSTANETVAALGEALLAGASSTKVPVLWALSGNDRTAAEFRACVAGDKRWQEVLDRTSAQTLELTEADHTLSAPADHDRFAEAVVEWLTRVA